MRETWVWSLGWEIPLEEGMATHSSILAWRIPWTEETDRLQSIGSQGVGQDQATKPSSATWEALSFTYIYIYGTPLQYSCLDNSMDRGAWQATLQGVAKSWTWLNNYHFHFLSHIYVLFIVFSIMVYHNIESIISCALQYNIVVYPSYIYLIASANHNSQSFPPSPPLLLAATNLCCLFLIHRYVHLCHILDSTYKWYSMVLAFLFLISLSMKSLGPSMLLQMAFISFFFYGWVILPM